MVQIGAAEILSFAILTFVSLSGSGIAMDIEPLLRFDRLLLFGGTLVTIGGAFGACFPELAIKINKAVSPGPMYAVVERVVPITPRLVRAWNFFGMLIGIALIVISRFVKE